MSTWKEYLEDNESSYLDELCEFLRIPSISSLPEHADDVRLAAEWVADRLKTAGIRSFTGSGCIRPEARPS
jgi:acetylornithine deacetylase/succinyl-diaminopimelate desuccinylase-like protein